MTITQHGPKTVQIHNTIIPACNIQVEGMPGLYKHEAGVEVWYGVYFEILFENATSWAVNQGDDQKFIDRIEVQEYKVLFLHGTNTPTYVEGAKTYLSSWQEFLGLYQEKLSRSCSGC